MRGNKKLLALLCVFVLTLTGCGNNSSTEDNNATNDTGSNEKIVSTIINEDEMFTDRDFKTDYDTSKSVLITLKGDSASCKSDAVKIKKNTITLSEEGTYIFSGTLNDGMIVVDAEDSDKLQIVLGGASITSSTSAALYVIEADKVFVTLAKGSENTLANGGTFEAIDDNNIDGAVFSKQDLTFNGSGALTITSPADHGIVCKDDLVFTGGTYMINCASHGLDANDSVRMTKASMTIASGKDGIHAENTDDTTLGFMYIKDGSLEVAAEGDGLSAGNSMQINNGSFQITSAGGSVNASKSSSDSWGNFMGGMGGPGGMGGYGSSSSNGSIVVSGGNLYINSSGDGMDANGTLEIAGGHTTIVGPTQGDTATLDYDVSGTITGGTFIGTGSTFMAQSLSSSPQGVVALKTGTQSAKTKMELKDSKGNTILSHEPELDFALVILSSPEIQKGESYTIIIGGATNTVVAN